MSFTVTTRKEAKRLGLKRYFTGRPCHRGHLSGFYTRGQCIACQATRKKLRNDPAVNRRYYIDSKNKNLLSQMLRGARRRAAERSVEFSLVLADMTLPTICPCCGKALLLVTQHHEPRRKAPHPDVPSLDRLDAKLGYTPDNVAIICMRCNELKRDATIDELRMIVAWIESVSRLSTHVGGAA